MTIQEYYKSYAEEERLLLESSVFKFDSPHYIERLHKECNIKKITNVGTDGLSYLLKNSINDFTPEQYKKWFENHIATCEDLSLLGYSLHGLFMGKPYET